MNRWTVRGVDAEAIELIQELAQSCGVPLGKALTAAVVHGAPLVKAELGGFIEDDDLVELVEALAVQSKLMDRALKQLLPQYLSSSASVGEEANI